jgi:chromosome partitioning protein
MGKVISISNHKGGVGKTTSVINIGFGLKNYGKRVLLIDIDPQANLTQSLGRLDVTPDTPNIYGAITGEYALRPIEIVKGLDIIPSTLDLAGADTELSGEAGREYILSELLAPLKKKYDYILIDTAPSLSLLTINSFVASDYVFIPLQPQYLALQGLAKLTDVIEKIKKRLNKKLSIKGVIITQYDSRKILNNEVVNVIKEHYSKELFKTYIRNNIALAEAPSKHLDIFRYDEYCNGAEDYKSLCRDIIKRFERDWNGKF